jgi:hypothetical protein
MKARRLAIFFARGLRFNPNTCVTSLTDQALNSIYRTPRANEAVMPSIKLLPSSGAVVCHINVFPCNHSNQGLTYPITQSHQWHCIKYEYICYLMPLLKLLTLRLAINK